MLIYVESKRFKLTLSLDNVNVKKYQFEENETGS